MKPTQGKLIQCTCGYQKETQVFQPIAEILSPTNQKGKKSEYRISKNSELSRPGRTGLFVYGFFLLSNASFRLLLSFKLILLGISMRDLLLFLFCFYIVPLKVFVILFYTMSIMETEWYWQNQTTSPYS